MHWGNTIRRTICIRPEHWALIHNMMDERHVTFPTAVFLALEVGLKTIAMQPKAAEIDPAPIPFLK